MQDSRDPKDVWRLFAGLWSDIEQETNYFRLNRPLLAHYTSLMVLEQIIKNDEIWLANPLFMNDIEEVWKGINEGTRAFLESPSIRSRLSAGDRDVFEGALLAEHQRFDREHAFDTYILCLSEHDPKDADGLLSMWRGYGDSGRGVAVVFDGGVMSEQKNTPLIISKVKYATADERQVWLDATASRFSEICRTQRVTAAEIPVAVNALFARLRTAALFTKHTGFSEEKEWRMAYLPERDTSGYFRKYLSYHNGPRGVEPKLKVKIAPVPELGNDPISLEALVRSIILGPTSSSPLAVASTRRMIEQLKRPELAKRVIASRIPYRAT